jgi:cell division protein FtsN
MNRTTQQGGIFLGLIIGLLLGLGIALAVAIYVTKVSVPFSNKTPPTGNESAPENEKLRDWNPNAVLQPKPPAPVMPASESAATDAAPDAAGATGTAATPPAGASPRPPAVTADPLGDLARSRTGLSTAAPAGSASAADPFLYFVQAGAFRTAAEADAQKAKLSLLGLDARVSERDQSGRTVFRVRIGAFDDKDSAEKIRSQLGTQGVEAVLVRVQK